jgi:hypothetical protein
MQPEQHDPKPDECSPQIMGARIRRLPEHQDANKDKRGRDSGLIDNQQYLDDQGRTYIRAEYRCKWRCKVGRTRDSGTLGHPSHHRAALLDNGYAHTTQKSMSTIAQRTHEQRLEDRVQRPVYARLEHLHTQ